MWVVAHCLRALFGLDHRVSARKIGSQRLGAGSAPRPTQEIPCGTSIKSNLLQRLDETSHLPNLIIGEGAFKGRHDVTQLGGIPTL